MATATKEEILNAQNAKKIMNNGCVLKKVTKTGKIISLKLKFDPHRKILKYTSFNSFVGQFMPSFLLSKYVSLYNIHEVKKGWRTQKFKLIQSETIVKIPFKKYPKNEPAYYESKCFSILKKDRTTLDLIAPNKEIRDAWVQELNKQLEIIRKKKRLLMEDKISDIDENIDKFIDFDEFCAFLTEMNLNTIQRDAKRLYKLAKSTSGKKLTLKEFRKFFQDIIFCRTEIKQIFMRNTTEIDKMNSTELFHFLQKEQKMKVSIDYCRNLIKRFEEDEAHKNESLPIHYLSLRGFTRMLLSNEFEIFNVNHHEVYQKMNFPLNHYWIASSHNTYLHHLNRDTPSGLEGYISALHLSCRCLELDIWDGFNFQDGPLIYHGFSNGLSVSSRILLRDVLEVIKENGFKTSEYPIILSLELHCGQKYRNLAAALFEGILGDMLYFLFDNQETQLPSPEQLKHKVLLKSKHIYNTESHIHYEKIIYNPEDILKMNFSSMYNNGYKHDECQQKCLDYLSSLAPYFKSRPFKSFADTLTWKFNEGFSKNCDEALQLIEEEFEGYFKYNRSHWCKIYPTASLDYANYDPIPHWNIGSTMVALNYHKDDLSMLLNEAKFTPNGKCGYILKPSYLTKEATTKKNEKVLMVKIITGQLLRRQKITSEVISPYVKIKLYGHKDDFQKFSTKVIKKNGFNPKWNQKFQMCVKFPDLAILVFKVREKSTFRPTTIGWYAISFNSIQPGYRHVHLLNNKREKIQQSTLFVKINIYEN